jgi:hypothetical protein
MEAENDMRLVEIVPSPSVPTRERSYRSLSARRDQLLTYSASSLRLRFFDVVFAFTDLAGRW